MSMGDFDYRGREDDRAFLLGSAYQIILALSDPKTPASRHWQDLAREWTAGYERYAAGKRADLHWGAKV